MHSFVFFSSVYLSLCVRVCDWSESKDYENGQINKQTNQQLNEGREK